MTQIGDVRTQLLPPGVSEEGFARALDGFTAALGADRVLSTGQELAEFRDPFAFTAWDE